MYTNLPVIEPIAVPDTYVSGVACVESLGDDIFRITHYAVQRCSADQTTDYAVIVSRLIVSAATIKTAREYIAREIAAKERVLDTAH